MVVPRTKEGILLRNNNYITLTEYNQKYITTPLLDHRFHVFELPIQNFMFLSLHVKSLFLHLQASCEIYENLHHFKISCYTVGTYT